LIKIFPPQNFKRGYQNMNKRRLLYFALRLKSSFAIIPRLLLTMIILGGILSVVAFCGIKSLDSTSGTDITKVTIAVVFDHNDPDLQLTYALIQNMESFDSVCNMINPTYDEAIDMLKKHELSAIVYIPSGLFDSILNGANLPAEIILPSDAGYEIFLFTSLLDAGKNSLAYSQAGIYAAEYLLLNHKFHEAVPVAEDYLNDFYLKYALNRGSIFCLNYITATGNINSVGYYSSSVFIFLFVLLSIAGLGYFQRRSSTIAEVLSFGGITPIYEKICELFSLVVVYLIPALLILIAGGITGLLNIGFDSVLLIIFVIFSIICFAMFVSCVGDGKTVSTMLMFLAAVGMMYLCARILPEAYLPTGAVNVGRYLPLYFWGRITDGIITGCHNATDIIYTLIYDGVFIGLSFLAVHIRRYRQ